MSFEALANELLLELFQFLDAAELFRAFHNLNSRFNALLFIQFRAYRVNFHSVLKYQTDFPARQYLPSIANKILSLRLSNNNDESPQQTDFFFSSGLVINQFKYLRSLSLCYINDEETLRKIIVDCQRLPYLTHLKIIQCHSRSMSSVDFSNILWNLPKLTHCHLDMGGCFHMPTVTSLSMKYLSISCDYWWLSQTTRLFQQTPYLQHLHLPFKNLNDNPMEVVPYLSSIAILKLSYVESLNVINTILVNVPKLTQLKVDTCNIKCDGYLWERIINDHLSKLKVFHLRMNIEFHEENTKEPYVDKLVDSFCTRFWLEKHQWYIRCHRKSERPSYESILLYTLPYAFSDFNLKMLTVKYKSTSPHDNDYLLYDKVNNVHYNPCLLNYYLSSIQFSNIRHLGICLAYDKHFCQIIPTLHLLNSLDVSADGEDAQFHLQTLLDRAPRLYSLLIKSWPHSQMPLVENTNVSLRRLDLRLHRRGNNSSFFSNKECNTFIHSPLAMQCEELLIKVQSRESILDLVNNMNNLRILHIQYKFSRDSSSSHGFYLSKFDLSFVANYNHNEKQINLFLMWLKDQLPETCIISKWRYDNDGLKLCIYLKKP